MKWDVSVTKVGYIQVEAETAEEAMRKADNMRSDDANWESGFGIDGADEVDY